MEQHIQLPDIATCPWFCIFWFVALIASGLYGWHAIDIFVSEENAKTVKKNKALSWHQRWFNFTGALVGWIATYCLIRKSSSGFDAADYFVSVVAFIGVTGHLPYTVIGIINGAIEYMKKLLAKWLQLEDQDKK